jgi:hypothetical protein
MFDTLCVGRSDLSAIRGAGRDAVAARSRWSGARFNWRAVKVFTTSLAIADTCRASPRQGIILMDAIFDTTQDEVIDGLLKVGLNPTPSARHSHRNGDHAGGAKPSGARAQIIMGPADWDNIERQNPS